MYESLAAEPWRELLELLLIPLSWIPVMQQRLFDFLFNSWSGWAVAGKFIFLLFPVLLFLSAIWCTHLSLYTIPFRSGRVSFAAKILIAWWDAARAVWLYWVGLLRFVLVGLGWCFSLARLVLKLAVEVVRQLIIAPFSMTGKLSQSYFQPGLPWIAFLMLIGWCMLEATIFTYIMFPTVSEVLTDLVGVEAPRFTGPILYVFLLLLIMGSFACLQALLDTIKRRDFKFIIQMLLVELFVMFFEVMFLYRELVDAITPWLAQQTGERFQMGVLFVLSLATFDWVGIRGMTWFLFGQYGTPPLLAFISRQPMAQQEGSVQPPAWNQPLSWWQAPLRDFKSEVDWLHRKSEEVLEYLTLPLLHVLAAALNFAMILLASKTVFSLPLNSLREVMNTREILSSLKLQAKKAGT